MSDRRETTDIADVLRDYLDGNPDARGLVEFVDASDLRDAAVEIARLRAERVEWAAENARLRRLLRKIAIHADEGQGGSDSYRLDRLVQIEKLAKLAEVLMADPR